MRGSTHARSKSASRLPTISAIARNIRIEIARYMSWPLRASKYMGPMIGSDSTIETTIEPEMNEGIVRTMCRINGWMELRRPFRAHDDDRNPKVLEKVDKLGPAPGSVLIFGRKEPGQRCPKKLGAQDEKHEG